jgi:predicted NUDIX family NTP pyrophosphohydrolase
MVKKSAGILVYRIKNKQPEVLLGHPGGPFFKNKDLGVWSIPKGEFDENEEPLVAAQREFKEETGTDIEGDFVPLKPVKYKNGKIVYVWAVEGNLDPSIIKCNTFPLEWPPKSGKIIQVPEIDKVEWFGVPVALKKIIPAQAPFIEELMSLIK